MKKLLFILTALPMIGFGQFNFKTYVPDDNFETYLENNGMGDGVLLYDSINTLSIEMLMYLDVSNQNIADLTGIEDFTVLSSLDCETNQLTSLDVSQNTYLTDLDCSENQITSLDLSSNIALVFLNGRGNQLTSLDLRSGTNILITYNEFTILNNPNLTCISVDDVNYSTINWTYIDAQHYFSTNCSGTLVQEHTINKELLKVIGLLGRETKGTKDEILFYIYDDGTVEKRIVIE